MDRFKLYAFVKNVTPPFLFNWFVNSPLYKYALKIAKKIDRPVSLEEIKITNGPLRGHLLLVNPNGNWQKRMLNGTYDQNLFSHLEKLNLADKTIYDIGAHIGYHSLFFSTLVGKKGTVFSFEPNPSNCERITKILDINPALKENIQVHNYALSNQVGTTDFLSTDNIEGGTSSGGFINEATPIWKKSIYTDNVGFKVSKVEVETIDNLIKIGKIQPPDMLKIDVEGAEHLVLEGAEDTIKKHKPIVLVELHSIYASYASTKFLLAHNYKIQILEKEEDGRIILIAKAAE